MNQIYDLVEACIKSSKQTAVQALLEYFKTESNQQKGTLFLCSSTLEYCLKRLINACLSVDGEIKMNAYVALEVMSKENLLDQVDDESVRNFVMDVSNYKKNLKKNEMEGNAIGRILIVKALKTFFQNDIEVIESFIQMLKDFSSLEQQIIQVCFLISNDHSSQAKLKLLLPKNQPSRLLLKILLNEQTKKLQKVTGEEIAKTIQLQKEKYPQKSLVLSYFGRYLEKYVDSASVFFRQFSERFLDPEEQADFHQIFYVLLIFKEFLNSTVIDSENYIRNLDEKLLIVWLDQFRVLNKKMKSLAISIKITFAQDPELAFDLLESFHKKQIYLENVSINHPFAPLYEIVDVNKFWNYLYKVCLQDEDIPIEQNEEEEMPKSHINELINFVQVRFEEMEVQFISATLVLLLNRYAKNQRKQNLYLLNNLTNKICFLKRKKEKKICTKGMLVLSKLKAENLTYDEEFKEKFAACHEWVKKKTFKIRKGTAQSSDLEILFYNFYINMLYFALIYPQEVSTCEELLLVHKNLFPEIQTPPRKKVKRQTKNEPENRPISVLNDIFISLMTRPPHFLRNAIHSLYESVLPNLDENDIGNMLTVITTPDAQFIEQI